MPFVTSQRERDKSVILNVVRKFGPLSRVEIHRLTQLRMSSISQLTRELLEAESVVENGLSDNPTGRKQVLLKVNPRAGFLLALEFDFDEVTAAVLNLVPEIETLSKQATDRSKGKDGLLAQLKRCARTVLHQAGVAPSELRGIGIADIGIVNRKAGVTVTSSQLEFWRDVPLVRIFEKEYGVPVVVDNATRCRGMAERILGAGEQAEDMVYVEYGAGIGSAIIAGGRLLEGHRTSAGEFGHTRVGAETAPCQCGSFGCLEAIASPAALANRFRELAVPGIQSKALDLAQGDREAVTGWHILEAASAGDKISSVIVEEMVRRLAFGLGNLVNILDPARVVLDRRLEGCGEGFLEQLRRNIRLQALSNIASDLVVCYGRLRAEAGVLGAALMVLDELFAIPDLKPPRFLVEPDAVDLPLR